jgi:hypothetical protein
MTTLKLGWTRRTLAGTLFAIGLMISLAGGLAVARVPQQEEQVVDDMKLIDQIEQLQKQLESADINQRTSAEKELITLGPVVLDYLEPAPEASSDALERIARIRAKLEKLAIEKYTQASRVTLKGKYSLEKAMTAISEQTGNRISVDQLPAPYLEKELQLELQDIEFWSALYTVLNQGSVMIDAYGGEAGTIKIIPDMSKLKTGDQRATASVSAPRCLAGMFDFSVSRIISERRFAENNAVQGSSTQLSVVARWEPRLQPISVEMPFEFITVVDENNEELKLLRDEGVFHAAASAEFPEIELIIPLQLVDRTVKRIHKVEAVLVALLPGRQETFRFKTIRQLQPGAELRKGGAVVTFEGVNRNDDLFGVTLKLSFDQSFNALESHRAWAYDNPMYLEDEQGNKVEPVTLEGLRQSNEEVAIRYYFADDPKDHRIIYKTVAAIVKQDIQVKLRDIDLP